MYATIANLEPATGPYALEALAAVEVAGPDAEKFLFSLVTADLAGIDTDHAGIAAWCDPKGRVQFLFRVLRTGDTFYLIVRGDAVDALVARLKMFVLRADVTIRCLAEDFSVFTSPFEGETDMPLPKGATLPWVADVDGRRRLTVAPAPGDTNTALQALWDAADIHAGVPIVVAELAGQFLPQMLNLEAFDGVSYRKGCYPGQEVIARLHFRGEVKRHLVEVYAPEEDGVNLVKLAPGTRLAAADAPEKSVGVLTFAVGEAGGVLCQAVLDRGAGSELVAEQEVPVTVRAHHGQEP